MSLLEAYLNQDVTWTPAQRKTDGTPKTDGSGKILYDSPQIIRVNAVDGFKLIRDKTGQEVVSSGYARVIRPVLLDDKINDRVVIGVVPKKGLTGEDEGRTVYLK